MRHTDLFMIQIDFRLFLRFWVRLIQALPNSVKPFPNYWVLFPNFLNVYMESIQGNFNPINLSFSLILNLPLDSSSCFFEENKVFYKKHFSNLVFGDDFAFNWIRWMYYHLFNVSGGKWQQTMRWRTRERPSRRPQRNRKCGYLLILSAGYIRKLSSNGINYSKHSRIKSFKSCYRMIQVLNWA